MELLAPLAFASAAVLSGVLLFVLRRARVLDIPNSRSSHKTPTPRGGGLAVMLALTLSLIVVDMDVDWTLILTALVLSAVGLADDLMTLPARTRLVAQIVASTVFAITLVSQTVVWEPIFLTVGIVGAVSYINAFNFMDGVNGISALQGALAGAWCVWVGAEFDIPTLLAIGTALAGAALGFLPWNAGGRIFLGDVGSYGMGAMIAMLTLIAWSEGVPGIVACAPLTVYMADTGWVMAKRAWAREQLTTPHRDHVYQRLVRQGWPHLMSAAWSTAVAAGCCLAVMLAWDSVPALVPVLLVIAAVVYLGTPRLVRILAGSGGAAA